MLCVAAALLVGAAARGEPMQQAVFPLKTLEPGNGFDDLQPLEAIIGSARVIGVAEGTHGAHEFLALRNRLFEYAVEKLGVTAIAVETGFTESIAVDDYVLGLQPMSDEVVRSAFSWHESGYAENRQLLEWMRAYNTRPQTCRPLHFYGIDLSGPRPGGIYEHARIAVDGALAYVRGVDPGDDKKLRSRLTPLLGRFNVDGYGALKPGERDALTATLADLVSLFERRAVMWTERTSALAYGRASRNAAVARHLDANFRTAGWGFRIDGGGDLNQRDAAMADTVRWILEREARRAGGEREERWERGERETGECAGWRGRVLLFAATAHLNKLHGVSERHNRPWTPLGAHLRLALGADFVSIGAFFAGNTEGFPYGQLRPAWLANPSGEVLKRYGSPRFVLDLRKETDASPQSFDAAIFLDGVTPAKLQ